jgi:TonB family protein
LQEASPTRLEASNGEIGRYLTDIQGKVATHLHYPPQALRRGEQGVVHVRLTLSQRGDLLDASTDAEAAPRLRDAALQAVRDSTPFPPPPSTVAPQAKLVVPVIFTIQ